MSLVIPPFLPLKASALIFVRMSSFLSSARQAVVKPLFEHYRRLDRYTSGDLNINGKSTKDFKDCDWDSYRNHSIGFVFQSYNLIPHQTVLSNVELALTLSGVSSQKDVKEPSMLSSRWVLATSSTKSLIRCQAVRCRELPLQEHL